MVVSSFRRSISLPKPTPPAPEKSLHVRSTSLPNRFHPVIAQLKDQIDGLKSWLFAPERSTSDWVCNGLNRLKLMHQSLDDFIQLPQSRDSLRRRTHWVENLLEHFLRFADAFGIFRSALVALREEMQVTQVAIRSRRRESESRLDAYVMCRRRLKKEVLPLLAVLREIAKKATVAAAEEEEEKELAGILREVNLVTVGVSAAVFGAVVGSQGSSRSFMGLRRRKREERLKEFEEASGEEVRRLMKREEKTALRRFEALENCVAGFERESESLFRSLIGTRVSLLNVLTQ
ncbi:uncharacterized protein [Aristolochia californica]|uniref:uncharacterized protein n=1 Tax=Aristolochia californica TaxID=171875 RepID=UPI0035D777B2